MIFSYKDLELRTDQLLEDMTARTFQLEDYKKKVIRLLQGLEQPIPPEPDDIADANGDIDFDR